MALLFQFDPKKRENGGRTYRHQVLNCPIGVVEGGSEGLSDLFRFKTHSSDVAHHLIQLAPSRHIDIPILVVCVCVLVLF